MMFCTPYSTSEKKLSPYSNSLARSESRSELLESFVNELTFWEIPKPQSPRTLAEKPKQPNKEPTQSISQSSESAATITRETVWKSAVDPTTGRTYYFDVVTRQTQWEKPKEIKAQERRLKLEKRNQDILFFHEMERNIYLSLQRGQFIPGVSASSPHLMTHRKVIAANDVSTSHSVRVRTISGMDETLLAELSNGVEKVTIQKEAVPSAREVVRGRPPLPTLRRTQSKESSESLSLSPEDRGFAESDRHPLLNREDSELAGERLLDGPIVEDVGLDEDLAPASMRSHIRRNTGGTIYVKSTMTNPDVAATMKCVCGVYRAHILQAFSNRSIKSPISVTSPMHIDMSEIFRDEDGSRHSRKSLNDEVPSLADITAFYKDFYQRSQMEHDTIIMSLIYVERLIKESNGLISPVPENWKSILFSCMVLASKVWDDLSMWNVDFSNVCGRGRGEGLSCFTLYRINQLELALLKSLNFNVKVPASEYAKYYFLIRSMLIKSGLLDEVGESQSFKPLDMQGAKNLETLSANYQDAAQSAAHLSTNNRRTRSLNDYDWLSPTGNSGHDARTTRTGPVLQQSVCLEQMVSMYR